MYESTYSKRNLAIDMLRALTMLIMIFVNDFWKIHGVPIWLEHAKHGVDFMGLADIVFPCFLFAIGMSIPYALERRYAKGYSAESTLGHILSRTFALLVMGAFVSNSEARLSPDVVYPIGIYWFLMVFGFICIWNQYPRSKTKKSLYLYTALKVVGVIALTYLAITFRSPKGGVLAPYWGILGAIGWSYLICSITYVFTRDRLRYLIPIWLGFVLLCILDTPMREEFGGKSILNLPYGNLLDGLLGIAHIGNGALVSFTMGGIILSILSVRYEEKPILWRLRNGLIIAGIIGLVGLISHHFWIVAKLGSTPTWVFYVIAISIATYTILRLLVCYGIVGWFNLIRPAGTATLTTYMIPYVFYGFADIAGIILPDWLTHGFMGIINCLSFAFVVIFVTYILEKINIKLKI